MPIDFIAYSMCVLEQEQIDISDSEVAERFFDVKEALDILDLIVFLPITKKHMIAYNEEDASFRKAVDTCFKKIYRDEKLDIVCGAKLKSSRELVNDYYGYLLILRH